LFLQLHASIAQNSLPFYVQSGTFSVDRQNAATLAQSFETLPLWQGKHYFLLLFDPIPAQPTIDGLKGAGLDLLGFIPPHSYLARAEEGFSPTHLINAGAHSVAPLPPNAKIDPALINPAFRSQLQRKGDKVKINLMMFRGVLNDTELFSTLGSLLEVIPNPTGDHLLCGWIRPEQILALAEHPAVQFIEPAPAEGQPEDREGRSLHRSHAIDNQQAGGYRYDGSGVVVGIADDGAIGPHIDFAGRLTQYTNDFTAGNTHGDMVSGITLGAANLDPTKKGMAPGAYLHMYSISGYPHVTPAVSNYNTLGTTITSTSYSEVNGGLYNGNASTIDGQIHNNEMLIHVFSAGNAGTSDHGYGAGPNWGNITGGYKAGKNVVACGNLRNTDQLESSSSRGPARDGRIKPDICSNGYNQLSTAPNNTYQTGGGTSAASPGVAGIFAQLSHAYRSLNSNAVPPTALLKACIINTAQDLGNAGPDFQFGWGRVNALKALKTMENNRYATGLLSQNDSVSLNISVPSTARNLRVMVYWADEAGAPNATKALVNNLDMRLIAPNGVNLLPLVLNPTPTATALNSLAIPGVDTLNNAEQVSVSLPEAGNYTVRILGTAVPLGPQRYWVVWEWHENSIQVTYPIGGEGFVPGETELIRWDATGVAGTFNVQYSVNNGQSWTNIATNQANTVRHVSWAIPSTLTPTNQALIRVSAGSVTAQSEQAFNIVRLVSGLAIEYICPTETGLTWSSVQGASRYIVYRLGQRYMDSIGTTTGTAFIVSGTVPAQADWFAVAPVLSTGGVGRRCIAIPKPVNSLLNCQAPPVANFSASSLTPCASDTVILTDQSLNAVLSRQWSITPSTFQFVGGTGASSQNPRVLFSATGAYNIQLIVSNNLGSDTLLRTDYIQVGGGQSPPIQENFAASNLPTGWSLRNPDNSTTWQFRTGTGPSGGNTGMAWINFYSYNAPGQEDDLITPVYDLTNISGSIKLFFDVAYARYSATLFDGLRVDVSTDCGQTFQPTGYFRQNLDLATVGTFSSGSFTPLATTDWRRDSIDLSAYSGSGIRLRFVAICGYGNNLYLTNIALNGQTSPRLSGRITYLNSLQTPMGNSLVELRQANQSLRSTTTDSLGRYTFLGVAPGNYNLRITHNKPWGGATATDALLVARQFSGLISLSGLPLKAADVNLSSVVNTSDALNINQRFATLISSFAAGDWQYDSTQLQVGAGTTPIERNIRVLASGDINGSMQPNPWLRAAYRDLSENGTIPSNPESPFQVIVQAVSNRPMGAISLNLLLPDGLLLRDVRLPQASSSDIAPIFHQRGRTARIAWHSVEGLPTGGVALMELWLVGSGDGKISLSDESECADIEGVVLNDVEWMAPRITAKSSEAPSVSIQIYPNPATDRIWISGLPAPESHTISGYHQFGGAQNSAQNDAEQRLRLKFYDLRGRLLAEVYLTEANSLALPPLPEGLLQVEIHNDSQISRHKLLIKP
jgi:PKD repeat protein